LNSHIVNLGGQIQNENKFDPYKTSISSTSGPAKVPVTKEGPLDTYDPTVLTQEIERIRQEREVN
jgi:hypothetical protein